MNQRKAFRETIELAESRNMPMLAGATHGLAHLKDMEQRITDDFSDAKLGRWLGWAQCVVFMLGYATLDEMKELNKRWS